MKPILLLLLTALLPAQPARAANERALKSMAHFNALQYRQYYERPYRGTAPLPGAGQFTPPAYPIAARQYHDVNAFMHRWAELHARLPQPGPLAYGDVMVHGRHR